MSIGKKWAYGLEDIVSGFEILVHNYVDGVCGTRFVLQSGHQLEVAVVSAETIHDLAPEFDLSLFGNCVKTPDTPWLFESAGGDKDDITEVLPRNLGLLVNQSASDDALAAPFEQLHNTIIKKFNRGDKRVHYIVANDILLLMFGAYVIRIRDVY